MTLIVEDGTGVTGANTYADVDRLRVFATEIGKNGELPVDDADCEPLLLNAMYVLEAECWQGFRTYIDQELSHPRSGLYHDGVYLPSDEVAEQIIEAQCSLALTNASNDLYHIASGASSGSVIHEEVVGAVVQKFSAAGRDASNTITDPRYAALVRSFTCFSGYGFGIGIRI